jgi:peptidoglycan/LPS O-acetylase OafA/YrhL
MAGSPRDNNFNLLRMLAALAVLLSHSFPLALGPRAVEPFQASLGMTLGTLAVGIFFTISGYLVTASLLSRPSLSDFALARARRIYPGLWVAIALTVFVLGAGATTLALADYLSHPRTWFYVLKNGTLLFGFVDRLPGVFAELPYPGVVNGSLWTLPIEVRLYVALAAVQAGLLWWRRRRPGAPIGPVLLAVAAACVAAVAWQGAGSSSALRFSAMFFVGAVLQLYRHRIAFSHPGLAAGLALLAACSVDTGLFALAFVSAGAYVVLCLAYLPGGWLRRYNRLGDYSYGLYIYAFPVQQLVVAGMPGIGVAGLFAASAAGTLVLAVLSWHLVESPVLRRSAVLRANGGAMQRGA